MWNWRYEGREARACTRIGNADDEQLLEHFADDDGELAADGRVTVGPHQQTAARQRRCLTYRTAWGEGNQHQSERRRAGGEEGAYGLSSSRNPTTTSRTNSIRSFSCRLNVPSVSSAS